MNKPTKDPAPVAEVVSTDELIERVATLGKVQIPLSIVESKQVADRLASNQQSMETLTKNNLNMEKTIMESDHLSYVFGLEQSMEKAKTKIELVVERIENLKVGEPLDAELICLQEALKELEQNK